MSTSCVSVPPSFVHSQVLLPSLPDALMYLHGTFIESYRKGWFPGLTVSKQTKYEWLQDIRSDGDQKQVPLGLITYDLKPYNSARRCCAAVSALARSAMKEGAWSLVAGQHPWALLCQ